MPVQHNLLCESLPYILQLGGVVNTAEEECNLLSKLMNANAVCRTAQAIPNVSKIQKLCGPKIIDWHLILLLSEGWHGQTDIANL